MNVASHLAARIVFLRASGQRGKDPVVGDSGRVFVEQPHEPGAVGTPKTGYPWRCDSARLQNSRAGDDGMLGAPEGHRGNPSSPPRSLSEQAGGDSDRAHSGGSGTWRTGVP
jgi:hypothetical protein